MGNLHSEHILIVEDDPIICESLRSVLLHCGYTCDTAESGASALDRLRAKRPDAVVAALGLPDCDGVELIAAMRRVSDVPVIVVSGRSAEADRIAALDHGADDYILKPFLPGELVARLRAKLRHQQSHEADGMGPGCEFALEDDLCLSRMERALLALLVQSQGATISEDRIIAVVWGSGAAASSADLRTLVLKLRRKLEMQHKPLFVLNERGVGYYVSRWGGFPRRARGEAHHLRQPARPSRPGLGQVA